MGDKPFDQAVETAWQHFTDSLAQRLDSGIADIAWAVVSGAGHDRRRLLDAQATMGRGCELLAQLPPGADRDVTRRLRAVGLKRRAGIGRGRFRTGEDAARAATVLLREVWDLPHPAFAEQIGAEPAPLAQAPALTDALALAVGAEFARVELPEGDSVLALRHSGGQIVVVRPDEALGSVEAYVLLASGALETESLLVAARLGVEFPELEFRFSGGHLLAVSNLDLSTTDGDSFREAVIELVALAMAQGPEIRERVTTPAPQDVPHDPRLAQLAAQCRGLDSQEAVDRALDLSSRSPQVLRDWYREAVDARSAAVARHHAGTCAAHLAHLREELTWTAVSSVVAVALARLDIGTA